MKDQKNDVQQEPVDLREALALRSELEYWEQKAGLKKAPLFARLLRRWHQFKREHLLREYTGRVLKRDYLKACRLGFIGWHHFYAKNKAKGILYVILCPTFVTFALALLDYLEAKIASPDEEGYIQLAYRVKDGQELERLFENQKKAEDKKRGEADKQGESERRVEDAQKL